MHRSRITFSSAIAARAASDSDEEEEPGEVIESAPPLQVGEEREVNAFLKKKLLKLGSGWETPVFDDEVTGSISCSFTISSFVEIGFGDGWGKKKRNILFKLIVLCIRILLDGTNSDFSTDKGQLLTYRLGQDEVASGLDQGILTMKKGEMALFTLPSSVRYVNPGAQSVSSISIYQFKVELVSWLTVVDICKDRGIIKKVLSSGDDMQTGDLDEVKVKYELRLPDGTVVARTPEGGLQFYVSQEHLCPALPRVLKTIKKGEKAAVTVQSQYAFGENGREAENGFPAIPANSELIIDLELLSLNPVLDVTGDLKVLKKILKVGEGIRKPNDGEVVWVRYTAMLEDGKIFQRKGFDEVPFEFVIDEEQVISGLDRAVATMLRGELSQVTIKPDYGFRNEVKQGDMLVPAGSTLLYEVELVDFTTEKETCEMTGHEKIEFAARMKKAGNDLYKIGKFQRAAKKYDKAIDFVNEVESFESGEEKLVKALRVSCWLNHAAYSLKLNDFHRAIIPCSKVLDIEFCNVKALYRRAQAHIEAADLDLAELDIQKALESDPENREVMSLQKTLTQRQLENNKRDAKIYANMFERMRKDTDVAPKKLKVDKA